MIVNIVIIAGKSGKMSKPSEELTKMFMEFLNRDVTDSQMNYISDLRDVLGALVKSEENFSNALLSKVEIVSNTKREDWK